MTDKIIRNIQISSPSVLIYLNSYSKIFKESEQEIIISIQNFWYLLNFIEKLNFISDYLSFLDLKVIRDNKKNSSAKSENVIWYLNISLLVSMCKISQK